MEILTAIGENIKKLRKEKGIKGDTLAKKLKVTKAAISQMENGLVDFKVSTLSSIASALGTDITSLIDDGNCTE